MKRKKLPLIICLCLFVCFAVGALVFFASAPKDVNIESIAGKNVYTIDYQQSGDGLYACGGAVVSYIDMDGNQSVAIDLTEKTGGERIRSLDALVGTDMLIAFAENNMAYILKEDGKQLVLGQEFSYSGEGIPLRTTCTEDEIFIVYQAGTTAKFFTMKAYDLNNVEQGPVRSGYFYNYGGESNGNIELELAKGLQIIDIFVQEDQFYVLHEGGLYRMNTSFEMNHFGELTEEERAEAGVVEYNKGTLDVTIAADKFNADALAIYTSGISAGCYNEKSGNIYMISNERKLVSYALKDVGSQKIGSSLQFTEVPDVVIQEDKTPKPRMTYDKKNEVGYVYFDSTDELVAIDFAKTEVEFRTKAAFDVSEIITNVDNSKVFVLYTSTDKGSMGQRFAKVLDVSRHRTSATFGLLLKICVIGGLAALVLSIFFLFNTYSEKYNKKVKLTLKKMWKHKWVYVILIPSLAGLFTFCYYPGIASIGLSFFDYTAEKQSMKWNNFANYINIFTNADSLIAFRNMVIFLATDIITSILPPLIFAFFLSFMRSKKFSNFTRTMLFIPGVIPSIAGMLIWKTGIYGDSGVLNTIIEWFGGEPVKFLTSNSSALTSIIMMGFPFIGSYLIFYGAIMNISGSYIEAAELEGCPLLKRLIRIDIPLIMPQIKYVFIMTLISSAQNFNRVYTTTEGAWNTNIPINVMYNHLTAGNYGMSSAYAAVLFLLMFTPMILNLKTQKKGME